MQPTEKPRLRFEPFGDSFHPSQVSGICVLESVPKRECRVASVKILQPNRCQAEWARESRFVEPVIVPGHLVGDVLIDIDRNRSVGLLIIEIECAGRCKRIQESRIAADEAAAI